MDGVFFFLENQLLTGFLLLHVNPTEQHPVPVYLSDSGKQVPAHSAPANPFVCGSWRLASGDQRVVVCLGLMPSFGVMLLPNSPEGHLLSHQRGSSPLHSNVKKELPQFGTANVCYGVSILLWVQTLLPSLTYFINMLYVDHMPLKFCLME